jgi:hypothetical protein
MKKSRTTGTKGREMTDRQDEKSLFCHQNREIHDRLSNKPLIHYAP